MKEASGNGYVPIIAQAIEEMKAEWGDTFSLEQVNLAELERRTGISREDIYLFAQGRILAVGSRQDLDLLTKVANTSVLW